MPQTFCNRNSYRTTAYTEVPTEIPVLRQMFLLCNRHFSCATESFVGFFDWEACLGNIACFFCILQPVFMPTEHEFFVYVVVSSFLVIHKWQNGLVARSSPCWKSESESAKSTKNLGRHAFSPSTWLRRLVFVFCSVYGFNVHKPSIVFSATGHERNKDVTMS